MESRKPRNYGLISALVIIVVVVGASLLGASALKGQSPRSNSSVTSSSQTGLSTRQTSATEQVATASGPVSVEVKETTVDRTSDATNGSVFYIFDVTLTGNDSVSHPVNGSYFTLIGRSNATYDASADRAVRVVLPAATLARGQSATGQLAFQLPDSDQPAGLEYQAPVQGVKVTVSPLPPPSRWVFSISAVKATWVADSTNSYYFAGAVVQNESSGLYYSTDTLSVKVELTPYKTDDVVTDGFPDLVVTAAAVSDPGFSISSISSPLPVTVSGSGNEVDFVADITLPNFLPNSSANVGTLSIVLSTN